MKNSKVRDLEIVSTKMLVDELTSRHQDIIIITRDSRTDNAQMTIIKTRRGEKCRSDKNYDLIIATELLQESQKGAIMDYLDVIKSEEDGKNI